MATISSRAVLFLAMITICCSCAQQRQTAHYLRSGKEKAVVVVLPVVSRIEETNLSWDLSREFTEEICKRFFDSSKVYLLKQGGSRELVEKLSVANPAELSRHPSPNLGACEYVVVTELIEHKENVEKKPLPITTLVARVRVVDIREEKPRLILQEILSQDFFLADKLSFDYTENCWGSENFQKTPMGIAHNHLVREIVSRVENYIEASR